jgi:two-component system chemotaxis sensor kinase CheA
MGITSQLQDEYDFEIVDEFIDHYSMMCDSMENIILRLEHKESYEQSVNELFRIFHNIKSASSFLHIEPLVKVSTTVENTLENARAVTGPASRDFVDWLLQASDQCNRWSKEIETDLALSEIYINLEIIPTI